MAEFAHGAAKMELSQHDIAKAVEFWLNERVLKHPCQVTGVAQKNATQWKTLAFTVELQEIQVEFPEVSE